MELDTGGGAIDTGGRSIDTGLDIRVELYTQGVHGAIYTGGGARHDAHAV